MPRIRPYKLKVEPVKSENCIVWKYSNTARPTYLIQVNTRQLKRLIKVWYKEKVIADEHYEQMMEFDTLIQFFDPKIGYFVAMSTPVNTLWNLWIKDNDDNLRLLSVLKRVFKLEE